MSARVCLCCAENGRTHHDPSGACKAYQAQVTWNTTVRRLAAAAGATVHTVPASPDFSTPKAITRRALEAGCRAPIGKNRWIVNTFYREVMRLAGRS